MKELPSLGGLGGEGGVAGDAGAGVGVGLGFRIGTGIGATGGGAVVVGRGVGSAGVGDTIAGFTEGAGVGIAGVAGAGLANGGGAVGVDGIVGIVGGFVDPATGEGAIFSLSLKSRAFGVSVGCCGMGDGIAGGTGGVALFVGLPKAIGPGVVGAGVGPVGGSGSFGAVGDAGTGATFFCESARFFGDSVPPVVMIVGDARGLADGCFFVSGANSGVAGAVFVSFFGVAGDASFLFLPTPLEYLPHSPAPSTVGKVGLGSPETSGGDLVLVWVFILSGVRLSFLAGGFQPGANAAGSPESEGERAAFDTGWGFKGGSPGMFGGDISLSSMGIGFFFSDFGGANSPGSAAATFGDSFGVGSCILSPSTAPIMHRNVQVMAIPILCSHFMRVLLCSEGHDVVCILISVSRDAERSASRSAPLRVAANRTD